MNKDSSFPKKGEDDFLTREETAFIQRLLSRPEAFPQAFWSAVIQKVALDGQPIPQSQVQGLSQFDLRSSSTIVGVETTTSTSFTNLATTGPTITGLSDGFYVIYLGALALNDTGGIVSMMTVQVNSEGTSDTESAFTDGAVSQSIFTAFPKEIRGNNNNTLTAKYRVTGAGTGSFDYRRIFAIKVGN